MNLICKFEGAKNVHNNEIEQRDYFFYKVSHTEYKVLLADILYFESRGRQVKMVTLKKEYIFYDTLKAILKRINRDNFIRVHRGFIVNYDYVRAFSSTRIELSNYIIIPIGLSKQKEVKQSKINWEEEENI